MKKLFLTLAVVAVAVTSCQKEIAYDDTYLVSVSGDNSSRIVGGDDIGQLYPYELNVTDSLPNPYSISNMRLAYESACEKYGESVFGNFSIDNIGLSHYYVKFEPNTEEQLDKLVEYFNNRGVIFFDYPLHCETYGEGMVKSSLTGIMPLYACIQCNITLPYFCNYTILDNIYMPDDQIGTIATLNANGIPINAMEILIDEAYCLVGEESTRTNEKWTPNGRLMVWDDLLCRAVPLEGVKVVARNGFKIAVGYTDENGYFSVNKTFNRNVKYSIIWEDSKWDIRRGTLGQAKFHNGNKTYNSWNVTFDNNHEAENYAHIHRALRYHFYSGYPGLDQVSSDRKVKVAYLNQVNNTKLGQFNIELPIGGPICDITVFGKTSGEISDIYGQLVHSYYIIGTVLHELGHASMYTQIGKRAYNNTELILRESWAAFVCWLQTTDFYELYGCGNLIQGTRNGSAVDSPNFFNIQSWWKDSGVAGTPMIIDIFDNNNQRQNAINNDDSYQRDYLQYPNDFISINLFTGNIEIIKQLVYTSQTKDEFMDNFKGKIKLFLISLSNYEKYASSY